MSRMRLSAVLALAAFGLATIVLALVPFSWTGALEAPLTATVTTARFTCSGVWTPARATGPTRLPYPLQGSPCGSRRTLQIVSVFDVLIAAGGVWVLLATRPRPDEL